MTNTIVIAAIVGQINMLWRATHFDCDNCRKQSRHI